MKRFLSILISVLLIFVGLYYAFTLTSTRSKGRTKADYAKMEAEDAIEAIAKDNLSAHLNFYDAQKVGLSQATIWVTQGSFWDGDSMLSGACLYAADVFPLLFSISGIDSATIFFRASVQDARGNERYDEVLKILYKRETAKMTNFVNLASDSNRFLKNADEVYIAPALRSICKNLQV